MTLQPRQPQLRGKCQKMAEALAAEDPSLRLVRGWYIDAHWGEQEHWWCVSAAGEIVDPTVEQFPTGHIPELRLYREYDGYYPCPGCGVPIDVENSPTMMDGYCCGTCYGEAVGFPGYGICRC